MTGPLCGETLLRIARGAVAARLGGPAVAVPSARWLDEPRAAFVTLRRSAKLHGCIGTVEATRSLGATVARHAALAAFEDPRSRPLVADDLGAVRFEVSVLGAPTPLGVRTEADAIAALRPGADGVILSYGLRRGVFLPQVWRSLSSPMAFLARLKEKAGLAPGFWDGDVVVERFSVQSFAEPGYREEGLQA